MKIDTEIRQAGMRALIQALGTVEAERFIAALTRDRFDYTEWRKTGLGARQQSKNGSMGISEFEIYTSIQHKLLITVAPDGHLKRVRYCH